MRPNRYLDYQLLDLARIDLPLLDEPVKAALAQYRHAHTLAWSATVQSYDGFFFVLPQYNWGYPAVLKNAVDYLYQEWRDRPASLFTYGTHGGGKAAAQFTGVLHGLHMRVLGTRVEAVVTDKDVDDDWQLIDIDATLTSNRPQLRQVDADMAAALAEIRCGDYPTVQQNPHNAAMNTANSLDAGCVHLRQMISKPWVLRPDPSLERCPTPISLRVAVGCAGSPRTLSVVAAASSSLS